MAILEALLSGDTDKLMEELELSILTNRDFVQMDNECVGEFHKFLDELKALPADQLDTVMISVLIKADDNKPCEGCGQVHEDGVRQVVFTGGDLKVIGPMINYALREVMRRSKKGEGRPNLN